MYERILFPTDGSEGATAALEHVLDLAAATDASVTVLNVADTTRDSVTTVDGEVVDALETAGERIVDEAAERARERGVPVSTETMQGAPAETIADYAAEFDLVAMPTHGRGGVSRLFLGSVTERVIRRSETPVLTLRPEADLAYPYERVLAATDGSDTAEAALDDAIGVARLAGATFHALSVVDTASLGVDTYSTAYAEELEGRAEKAVETATERAAEGGLDSVVGAVESGASIHGAVLDYIEENDIDLLVVGTHGRTGLDRFLIGSVAEKLVRAAPVPVLVVREQE